MAEKQDTKKAGRVKVSQLCFIFSSNLIHFEWLNSFHHLLLFVNYSKPYSSSENNKVETSRNLVLLIVFVSPFHNFPLRKLKDT